MNLPFELFVASRYMRSKRRESFISIITAFSNWDRAGGSNPNNCNVCHEWI